jgi:nucleotidyltransferase/DNA polymerase involved in DNA repair
MPGLVALVDCNNFYASCERLFQPELAAKPIVVLSNNDGFCNRALSVKPCFVPLRFVKVGAEFNFLPI